MSGEDKYKKITKLVLNGESLSEVGNQFGLSPEWIRQIVHSFCDESDFYLYQSLRREGVEIFGFSPPLMRDLRFRCEKFIVGLKRI